MSLTIGNNTTYLEIGKVDTSDEVTLSLSNDHSFVDIYINHQDAIEIINHLKQQFEL